MSNFTHIESAPDLSTVTVVVPTTDIYSLQGTLTLPNIVPSPVAGAGGGAGTGSGGGPQISSQVVVTIKQNGSTVFTSSPGDRGFCVSALNCSAGDVLTIERSSSLDQDKQFNAVKMTLNISEGAV
jgi:hypothetical protein